MSLKNIFQIERGPGIIQEEPLEEVLEEVVEKVVEFDPEAGKSTDNPFTEEIIPDTPEDITFINNYESMKVVDLKDILKQRNLSVKGKKEDLILRLEESDAEATKEVSTVEEEEDPAWVQAAASVLEKGVSEYEEEQPIEGEPIGET